jgi:hypothetical protein
MKISRQAVKQIRSFALHHASGYGYSAAAIVLEGGRSPPRWEGISFHFENKSGDLIRHPNAYRRAWGKPIYIASTRHIIVGKDWVKQLEIDLLQVKLTRAKKNGRLASRELAKFIFYFGDATN